MRNKIAVILPAVLVLSFFSGCMVEPAGNMNIVLSSDREDGDLSVSLRKSPDTETMSGETEDSKNGSDEASLASKEDSPGQDGDAIRIEDAQEEFEGGKKFTQGDIKVVDLKGTWREMGRQYGHLMKAELEDVRGFLDRIIERKEGNADRADAIVDMQTAQTPYRIKEFFEGACETSGLTVEELQTVNAVERIGGLPKCSVAMAWDEYAASDLVIGRNYDYSDSFSELKDAIAVTVYHPADGALAAATIGYVGEIYAVNGINEKGIFLELNNGRPSANIKTPNLRITGTTMLFECLFEADELEDMEFFFNTTNCSSSYIINVADENEGQSFEWCPIGVKRGDDDLPEGLLVSTNYYVNPDWLFADVSDESSWAALTRRSNLIDLCEKQKGELDEEKMMEIIDKTLEEGGAKDSLTVYQMVVVPKEKRLWLQITGGNSWTLIDLDDFLNS